MGLTRDFRITIVARMRRDPGFRRALFLQSLNSCLEGETAVGKAMLRDLINATIGFEPLAAKVELPSKSLHRMLSPRGNPSIESFFSIVRALQHTTGLVLRVTTNQRTVPGRPPRSSRKATP